MLETSRIGKFTLNTLEARCPERGGRSQDSRHYAMTLGFVVMYDQVGVEKNDRMNSIETRDLSPLRHDPCPRLGAPPFPHSRAA